MQVTWTYIGHSHSQMDFLTKYRYQLEASAFENLVRCIIPRMHTQNSLGSACKKGVEWAHSELISINWKKSLPHLIHRLPCDSLSSKASIIPEPNEREVCSIS